MANATISELIYAITHNDECKVSFSQFEDTFKITVTGVVCGLRVEVENWMDTDKLKSDIHLKDKLRCVRDEWHQKEHRIRALFDSVI